MRTLRAICAGGLATIVCGCSKPDISGTVVAETRVDDGAQYAYVWSLVVKDRCGEQHAIAYAAAGKGVVQHYWDLDDVMRSYARLKAYDDVVNIGDKITLKHSHSHDGEDHWHFPQKKD